VISIPEIETRANVREFYLYGLVRIPVQIF